MTPDTMEKFELRVAYSMFGISHSMRILCKAVNDDEVIRAGFVLADMLEYQGAENAVIHVVGGQERDIATFGQSEDVDSIDRPVTLRLWIPPAGSQKRGPRAGVDHNSADRKRLGPGRFSLPHQRSFPARFSCKSRGR